MFLSSPTLLMFRCCNLNDKGFSCHITNVLLKKNVTFGSRMYPYPQKFRLLFFSPKSFFFFFFYFCMHAAIIIKLRSHKLILHCSLAAAIWRPPYYWSWAFISFFLAEPCKCPTLGLEVGKPPKPDQLQRNSRNSVLTTTTHLLGTYTQYHHTWLMMIHICILESNRSLSPQNPAYFYYILSFSLYFVLFCWIPSYLELIVSILCLYGIFWIFIAVCLLRLKIYNKDLFFSSVLFFKDHGQQNSC